MFSEILILHIFRSIESDRRIFWKHSNANNKSYLRISCNLSNVIQIQILKDVILSLEGRGPRLHAGILGNYDVASLVSRFITRTQYRQMREAGVHLSFFFLRYSGAVRY